VEEPRKVYRPPYQSTQPSVDQKRFWQSSVEVTPEEPQWPGYGHLMDSLLKGEATGQAYGIDSQPAASQYTPVTYATSRPTVGRRKGQDTNKYVGGPQQVSTKPIVVGPGLGSLPQIKGPGVYQHQPKTPKYQNQLKLQDKYPRRPHLQPPSDMLSSYSDRYGWTQQSLPQQSPPRNWTSLDLAKPVWEEDDGKNGLEILTDFKLGQVQELDLEELGGGKETFGIWDQSLNLLPAMSRSTEPRPKQWILLSKSRSVEEEGGDTEGESRMATASLGLNVDGSRFADSY